MGKDREGKFHPPKGKPSDTSKEGTGLRGTMGPDDLQSDQEMTDKYTEGEDKLASNVHMRHRNRNTRKGKDQYKASEEGSSKTYKEEMYTEDRTDTTPQEIYGVLTKDLLKELAAFRSTHCITCIFPTHRAGMEVNEQHDAILFKNILQDLKITLEQKNADPLVIERILEPGFELLRNDAFWHNLTEGLAVFIADGFFKYIKLPFTPGQEVIVNNSLYLISLLPLLNTNAKEEFYLLLIRRNQAALYKADAYGLHEVRAEGMPENIAAVMNFEEENKESMAGNTSENTGIPEHITAGRPDKLVVDLYVKKIEAAFMQMTGDQDNWPLILAGQPDLLQAFRKTTAYSNVMDAEFTMEDEYANNRKIFEEARKSISEKSEQERRERLEIFYNHTTTGLTTSIPGDVIPAAWYGQVRTLFVLKGAHIWGHFDEINNQLEIHETRQEGDDCLVDRAAVQTILHGGEVYILEEEQMPKEALLAALLRYS